MANGAACLTVTLNVIEWLIEPLVPVIVTVEVLSAALNDAANWKLVPEKGPVKEIDRGADESVVTPAGNPEIVRLIAPVNPLRGFACTVWNRATPPCWSVTALEFTTNWKSPGTGVGVGFETTLLPPPPPHDEIASVMATTIVAGYILRNMDA